MQLIVWDSTGSRQLKVDGDHLHVLVEAGAHGRPAQIVRAVRGQFGFEVAFLRAAAENLVEVERLDGDGPLPPGMAWHRRRMLPAAARRHPWERPGWIRRLLPGLDAELARLGLRRTGPPVQIRYSSVTGLLRIPTDRHPVWLKAVPPMFAHEGPVTGWLAGLASDAVPTVLAATPGWWLAAPFPEPGSGEPTGDVLVTHAKLQVAATARIGELRAAGCPDRPLSRLLEELTRLTRRPDLLGRRDRDRLDRLLPALEVRCREVDALGFPATLVHGDLTPDNVRWTRKGWFLYDWTDTCIGHPFVDLAMPLLYVDEAIGAERSRAYAAVWAGLMPLRSVERALQAAPVIGAAFQTANYARIADQLQLSAGDSPDGKEFLDWLRFWLRSLLAVRTP